jgi:putative copper export protein
MITYENVLHFLHILSAIVWVGGVLTLNVLAVRVGRGPDRAAQASLLRLSDLYGRAVIAPAGVLSLITGLLLVGDMDLPLSTLWVEWGLIGLLLSVALGATLIRATNGELRRLTENLSTDEPRRLAQQRRAGLLYGINVLILLSVVGAMVLKPTA